MFRKLFRGRIQAPDPDPNSPPPGDPPPGDPPPSSILKSGKPADPPPGDPPPGDPQPWAWAEDVPGTGARPEWFKADKYKSISEQAKAAAALEAKLGPAATMLGAPEGDYELPSVPDGVEGSWDPKDPMLAKFIEVAKAKNLSQEAFNDILAPFAQLIAEEEAAQATAVSDALAALGPNITARIEQAKQFMVAHIGEEGFNALDAAINTDVKAYQALERLVALAAGDAQLSNLPGNQGPGFTRADIEAEQYKVFPEGHPMAGKRMYEHDKEHRAKVDAMWKKLFPGQDETVVL